MTYKIGAYHFKIELYIDQAQFFEFQRHRNYMSMPVMIESIEQFKKSTSYRRRNLTRVQAENKGKLMVKREATRSIKMVKTKETTSNPALRTQKGLNDLKRNS